MKKLSYLIIAITALSITAFKTTPKTGYVITGTLEGGADGDSVFLATADGRNLTKTDTAIIKNGTFSFKGIQDSTVSRYITSEANGQQLMMDFFLENGNINIALTKNNDSATGTPSNDAYQQIRIRLNDITKKMNEIYTVIADSTQSDEQKEAKKKEVTELEEIYETTIKEGVKKNITNPVGIHLFKQTFYNNSTEENEALLLQIPVNYQSDETILKIQELTSKQKKTAIGSKFIDFEMQSPEGKAVKLSDYVGKGKVVLVDFWASWCRPCRNEMPNLVEAYAKFKGKNFEIIGVSLDKDEAAWKEAIKKMNMTWPQMSDLKFWQSEGAQLYAVNSIPHTVLIDGQGIIIARGLHGEELISKLSETLK